MCGSCLLLERSFAKSKSSSSKSAISAGPEPSFSHPFVSAYDYEDDTSSSSVNDATTGASSSILPTFHGPYCNTWINRLGNVSASNSNFTSSLPGVLSGGGSAAAQTSFVRSSLATRIMASERRARSSRLVHELSAKIWHSVLNYCGDSDVMLPLNLEEALVMNAAGIGLTSHYRSKLDWEDVYARVFSNFVIEFEEKEDNGGDGTKFSLSVEELDLFLLLPNIECPDSWHELYQLTATVKLPWYKSCRLNSRLLPQIVEKTIVSSSATDTKDTSRFDGARFSVYPVYFLIYNTRTSSSGLTPSLSFPPSPPTVGDYYELEDSISGRGPSVSVIASSGSSVIELFIDIGRHTILRLTPIKSVEDSDTDGDVLEEGFENECGQYELLSSSIPVKDISEAIQLVASRDPTITSGVTCRIPDLCPCMPYEVYYLFSS